MSREYPSQPFIGAAVVIKRDAKVLLMQRGKSRGRGMWSIPGGKVELGEKVMEAAKREVREETGLEVEIDRLLDVVDGITYDKDGRVQFHFVIIDFLGHPVAGELKLSWEHLDARWIGADELEKYPMRDRLKSILRCLFFPNR